MEIDLKRRGEILENLKDFLEVETSRLNEKENEDP